MKIISPFLAMLIFISCASGKEKSYTASTPGGAIVKTFLGIPLTDSVDFIRWKLTLSDNQYELQCNYGIGKPGTNGFYNGGKSIEISGVLKKEKNTLQFQNGNRVLKVAEINGDLLHLMDAENNLLVGNGGWSYSLNNLTPSISDQISFTSKQSVLKDTMAFEGRTPCGVPGVIKSDQCYKLKWFLVLFANSQKNEAGTYRVFGTGLRKEGGRTGSWKILNGKDGRIIYQLNDEKGNGLFYFVRLDENILAFTDAKGNLLVGDLDFSYTLNRTAFKILKS